MDELSLIVGVMGFAVFAAIFHSAPRAMKTYLLVTASYAFYAFLFGGSVVLLAYVTAVSYGGMVAMGRPEFAQRRGTVFSVACILTLLPMFSFKLSAMPVFAGAASVLPDTLIGAFGISYFSFQAAGLLIDRFTGRHPETPGMIGHAAFVSFFPCVVSGPIQRASDVPQLFDGGTEFTAEDVLRGVQLIFFGVFLKVVLGDYLAGRIAPVFEAPDAVGSASSVIGVLIYPFQLYMDFQGYSLIAIGAGLILGLRLRLNFSQPFLSRTLAEFWRVWHISLTSWVRDYIFTPLMIAFRTRGTVGIAAASVISFSVICLWHHISAAMVVLGVTQGLMVAFVISTDAVRGHLYKRLGIPPFLVAIQAVAVTYVVIAFSLVLLRAADLGTAVSVYEQIFSSTQPFSWNILLHGATVVIDGAATALPGLVSIDVGVCLVILLVDGAAKYYGITYRSLPATARAAVYAVASLIILFTFYDGSQPLPFVYSEY